MTKAQTSVQPFCGLQTEQRRQASDPFAAGACSYAQALLAREAAVQSLQQRMWQEEVAESAVQGQAARMRRAAAEEEEREGRARAGPRAGGGAPPTTASATPLTRRAEPMQSNPCQQQGRGVLHLSAGALLRDLLCTRLSRKFCMSKLQSLLALPVPGLTMTVGAVPCVCSARS